MDKQAILEKVKSGSYSQQQLMGWLGAMPNPPKKPTEYKVGDVFMHGVFKHPYVILKQRKNDWVCSLLTSEDTCPEVLEICQSRFFATNYFTKALFTVSEVQGGFVGIYDNNKHLREVYLKLKQNLL